MNLCLTCRGLGRGVHGGLPQATRDLAQALAGQGHAVFVVTEGAMESTPGHEGVTTLPVHLPKLPAPFDQPPPESVADNLRYAAGVHRAVSQVHEQIGPLDAVIAPLWRSEGAVCLLDGRFPTIVTCQTGLWISADLDDSYRSLPDIDQRLSLERAALVRSRYLHGLTEAILTRTIADFGLRPEVAAVVNRGLTDRCGQPADRSPRTGPVEVLYIGRIEPRKGVDVLLRAADALVAEGLDVSLTITGPERDQSLRQEFDRSAADHAAYGAVRFTGAVTDAERDRLLAASDIVCQPSRYESHGIVLIEAMMFGKAIATCSSGGIGEVVEPDRTALVSPPEDAVALADSLRRLLSDPVLRADLGAAARQAFTQRFDARVVAPRMEGLIERVAGAHRPSMGEIRNSLSAMICEVPGRPGAEADELAAALLAGSEG